MSSIEVGIEEARKRLGDLVTAVQQGADVILTRNGKPSARLIPHVEEYAMDTTTTPPLSEGTTAAVANLIEYTIEGEYGQDVAGPLAGAKTLALAGLQFDLRDQFVTMAGSDRGLPGYAETTLRMLVRDGLAERACQRRKLHPTDLPCRNHYEADVPEIDGALLCGTCHVDEYQARS